MMFIIVVAVTANDHRMMVLLKNGKYNNHEKARCILLWL